MPTTGSITSGQIVKVTQLSEDAIRRAVRTVLDGQSFTDTETFQQKVVERGDEYVAAIERKVIPIIEATLREMTITGEFQSEEISSNYGYLSGYRGPKSIADQLRILRQYFPQLGDADDGVAKQDRPAGSEGWFAIPRWQAIAATYGEALELALDALKQQRKDKVDNFRKGRLGPKYLRLLDKTIRQLERIGEQQQHDILVVAAQFGLRHRGRSVRRARAVMGGQEFGLGPFEIGIMLLTHPERLAHLDDLWIDCDGCEYNPDAVGQFGCCPFFGFTDGRLRFAAHWFGHASVHYGSVSAFFPPSTM